MNIFIPNVKVLEAKELMSLHVNTAKIVEIKNSSRRFHVYFTSTGKKMLNTV